VVVDKEDLVVCSGEDFGHGVQRQRHAAAGFVAALVATSVDDEGGHRT
jgi:hypothetical protein